MLTGYRIRFRWRLPQAFSASECKCERCESSVESKCRLTGAHLGYKKHWVNLFKVMQKGHGPRSTDHIRAHRRNNRRSKCTYSWRQQYYNIHGQSETPVKTKSKQIHKLDGHVKFREKKQRYKTLASIITKRLHQDDVKK